MARMGLPAIQAVVIPVIELVWPGPPVTTETPGWPVTRAQPSAMWVAPDSWRVSTMATPSSIQALKMEFT